MCRTEKRGGEQGPGLFGIPDQLLKKPGPSPTKKVIPRKDLVPAMAKRHLADQQKHSQLHQSMVDNLKRKQSETVGQGSPVSSMNKNVKTSVEIEPEPENVAEKEKQVTEKPRREKESPNGHKGYGEQKRPHNDKQESKPNLLKQMKI